MASFSRRDGASTPPPRLSAPAFIEYTIKFVPLAIYDKRYGAAALVTIVALKSTSGTAPLQSSSLPIPGSAKFSLTFPYPLVYLTLYKTLFLHKNKTPLFSYQSVAHSLKKNTGVWGRLLSGCLAYRTLVT